MDRALILPPSWEGAIFSSAGSEWAPVWEGLARQAETGAEGPRYLDLAHETIAAGMATGYTALTGRVQVVQLHAGGPAPGTQRRARCVAHWRPGRGVLGRVHRVRRRGRPGPGSHWYRNLSIVGGPQAMARPVHQVGLCRE